MKSFLHTLSLALCSVLLTLGAAQAQTPVSYSAGDLLLGFRASSGDGSALNYVVNVGPASQFTNAANSLNVSGIGNIAADLADVFGPDWSTRADVFWSVSGTTGSFDAVGGDPAKTLFATRVRPVPNASNPLSMRWIRGSTFAQGPATNKMNGMAYAYGVNPSSGQPNASTSNSSKAVIQNGADLNSYASYQPGGTVTNAGPSPGISFAYFNPTIEGSFANGTAGSVLELYRMTPASGASVGAPGDFLGTFQLSDAGVLTFTPATPTVSVGAAQYTVNEADASGKAVVTLVRGGDLSASTSVNLSTADGTAVAGADYTAQSNTTVTFAADQSQKTVEIAIANRAGFQGDRTFTVALSAPSGAKLGTLSSATVTILESETALSFQSPTYSVAENAAGGKVSVTVVRSGSASSAVSATLSTTDGTAAAGTDYTALTTTVSLAANETQKSVDIAIANRSGAQGGRAFAVSLSGASAGVTLASPTSAQVTITDAVFPGTLSFSAAAYQASESANGDVLLSISVVRANGQDGPVSVDVSVAGGTATAGADFTVPSSPVTLSWGNGETGAKSFDITVKGDAVADSGETINLLLQNATGGATLGAQAAATVTLFDADDVVPTITLLTPKANAKLSAANVTFSGNAKDAQGVARVEVVLNGVLHTVDPGSAKTDFNWSVTLVPEQGINTVQVKAFDLQNNASTAISRTFTFANLRPLLAGKYNGLITQKAAGPPVDRNGLAALTVTSTGAFTGKVSLSGGVFPLSGVFLTDGSARFGKLKTETFEILKKAKPANISLGHLSLSLDTGAGHKITGALRDGTTAGAQLLAEIPHADQALYTSRKAPLPPFLNVPAAILDLTKEKGKYTAVFQADAAPNSGVAATAFPQGDGFGFVTVSTAGVVKVVGKLADGTVVAYSNTLSVNNDWPLFVPLYAKKGLITGNVRFDSTQAETDAAGTNLLWVKPEIVKDKIYPAGWANGITVDFAASKYLAPVKPTTKVPTPPNPDTVLGPGAVAAASATTANIEITASAGGLTTSTSNDASLDAKNKVTVIGGAAGATAAAGLKTTFAAPTGAMSGSFIHPGLNKAVTFSGVAYQKTHSAAGFFQYFPPKSAPAGTPAESGAVGVELK